MGSYRHAKGLLEAVSRFLERMQNLTEQRQCNIRAVDAARRLEFAEGDVLVASEML